jgi:hypothetical protein
MAVVVDNRPRRDRRRLGEKGGNGVEIEPRDNAAENWSFVVMSGLSVSDA